MLTKYYISLSGGKDSTFLTHLLLQQTAENCKYPVDGIVYFELENEFPFVYEIANKIEKHSTHKNTTR